MLSNILMFLVAVLIPIFCYFAFKLGYKTALLINSDKNVAEMPEIIEKSVKKIPETEEIRKANAILANINAYDGTSLGQKEIE